MSGSMTHPPEQILAEALVDLGLGTAPSSGGSWPVRDSMEVDSPDDCITVFGTAGTFDARSNFDGEQWERYGLQVRVRAMSQIAGRAKAEAVKEALDKSMSLRGVVVSSSVYVIEVTSRSTSVVPLGKEPETDRRIWTINATASMRQVS